MGSLPPRCYCILHTGPLSFCIRDHVLLFMRLCMTNVDRGWCVCRLHLVQWHVNVTHCVSGRLTRILHTMTVFSWHWARYFVLSVERFHQVALGIQTGWRNCGIFFFSLKKNNKKIVNLCRIYHPSQFYVCVEEGGAKPIFLTHEFASILN